MFRRLWTSKIDPMIRVRWGLLVAVVVLAGWLFDCVVAQGAPAVYKLDADASNVVVRGGRAIWSNLDDDEHVVVRSAGVGEAPKVLGRFDAYGLDRNFDTAL